VKLKGGGIPPSFYCASGHGIRMGRRGAARRFQRIGAIGCPYEHHVCQANH